MAWEKKRRVFVVLGKRLAFFAHLDVERQLESRLEYSPIAIGRKGSNLSVVG
jgi:hypothetical protein